MGDAEAGHRKVDLDDTDEAEQFMDMGCNLVCHPHTKHPEVSLALLKRRPFWSDNFCYDYIFHVANNHPLLSCVFCSPLHPYSKRERLLVLLIVSLYTIAMESLLYWMFQPQRSESGAMGSLNIVPVLLFITIPIMLVQVVLEQMSVLDARFQTTEEGCVATFCNKIANAIKGAEKGLFDTALWWSIGITIISVALTYNKAILPQLCVTFWESRIQAWILWFPSDLLMPCFGFVCKWRAFRRHWVERMEKRGWDILTDVDDYSAEQSMSRMLRNQCFTAVVGLFIVGFFLVYVHMRMPDFLRESVDAWVQDGTDLAMNMTR